MKRPSHVSQMKALEAFALESGAYRVKAFSSKLVAVDERVRMKCQIPLCPHFGQSLMCPPNVPTVEEFRTALKLYKTALLLQTRSLLRGESESYDKEEVKKFFIAPGTVAGKKEDKEDVGAGDIRSARAAAVNLHKLINEVESKAMALGFPYALGLIGGECMLCPGCVGTVSGKACRRPYEARPSMEGVGIDVVQTSIKAGLPFDIPPKKEIIWSGLILID
jgi:predicted metal-binding protein